MRSSSEEEVDESDYSEDEEDPSIEMIEQTPGPDREIGQRLGIGINRAGHEVTAQHVAEEIACCNGKNSGYKITKE